MTAGQNSTQLGQEPSQPAESVMTVVHVLPVEKGGPGSPLWPEKDSPFTRSRTRPCLPLAAKRQADDSDGTLPAASTPRPRKKKVRFSDPGARLDCAADVHSTGLTPALLRTSFEESRQEPGTPSRSSRRRSAPLPQRNNYSEQMLPIEHSTPCQVYQFAPLVQILDHRTRRRLRRVGLSDEINRIQWEKRETVKRNRARDAETAALKQELEALRAEKGQDERAQLDSRRIDELQTEIRCLRENSSMPPDQLSDVSCHGFEYGDTMIVDNSTMADDVFLTSNSPILRPHQDSELPMPDISLSNEQQLGRDASTQASLPDHARDAEMHSLSLDLEVARQEKINLFNEWQASGIKSHDGPTSPKASSPPSEFMGQIVPTLKAALTRASDACLALDAVRTELSRMGFLGNKVDEIIGDMRQSFRSARMELERITPGEIVSSLNNGNATLEALVQRLKSFAHDLHVERVRYSGLMDQKRALQKQFDNTLIRNEEAAKKIKELEETIDTFAGDMLHVRMRVQELEDEIKEKDIGIGRLNAALEKYHAEVKNLEEIISSLEDESGDSANHHFQQIVELESKLTAEEGYRQAAESLASEREKHIANLHEIIQQGQIRICDLIAQVECLEKERTGVIESLEQKAAQEVGFLNVRLSEVSTALEIAKNEIDKLRRKNTGLEERLELETGAQQRLIDNIMGAISAEGRHAKVRTANWKLKSDDLDSEPMLPGSEPVRASTVRFGHIQVGRGKDRRSLDSGIGILTEEETGPNEDDDRYQAEPSSDFDIHADIPNSDVVGLE